MSDLAHVFSWPQDEAGLVAQLQGGSESAFDWLVTHYHGPVFGLVIGMISDPADAADVTQEVFLKAYRGIGKFRGSSSLKTWLYRIAIREAANARRWWWRHHRQQASLETDAGSGATLSIEDPGESPLESFAASEVQQIVRSALRRVPAVFRGAVILHDLEGLGYEEVAEVLDVSLGTVKSRILRGRQALRLILAPMFEGAGRAERTPERGDPRRRSFGGSAAALEQGAMEAFAFEGGNEQTMGGMAPANWARKQKWDSPEGGVR